MATNPAEAMFKCPSRGLGSGHVATLSPSGPSPCGPLFALAPRAPLAAPGSAPPPLPGILGPHPLPSLAPLLPPVLPALRLASSPFKESDRHRESVMNKSLGYMVYA